MSNVILDQDLGLTLWVDTGGGAAAKNSTISEYGHVAYQIKGNDACSNMVANIFPADHQPGPWGWGKKVKIQLIQNMGMLHIKLKNNTDIL